MKFSTNVAGRHLRTLGLVVVMSVTWVGSAGAQATADTLFKRLDVNGDGVVTLVDLETLAERRVARIDADGDGQITRAELRAFEKRWAVMRADAMLAQLDKNRDGVIGRDEMGAIEKPSFAQIDLNKDGSATKNELETSFQSVAERRSGQIFARFDADKDGVISRAERSAMNQARFKQLDSDGDGQITKAEVAAAFGRWRARQTQPGAREASSEDKAPTTQD